MELKVGSFTFGKCDKIAAEWMHEHGQTLLKYSLAIIFIWLGALKSLGISPVNDLVTNTITWLPPDIFIPILGFWEIAIGVCLLIKPLLRIALTLLFLQLFGTVLPLFILPEVCFKFPYALTLEGQYIIKNCVILSAAIVVGGGLSKEASQYADQCAQDT